MGVTRGLPAQRLALSDSLTMRQHGSAAKPQYGYTTAADITPSDHDWNFVGRATAQADPMGVPRGKVTGGSSAILSHGP